MTKICALLAEGFEEIEAITVIDVLRRASAQVCIAGVTTRDVCGSHGIRLTADALLSEVSEQAWDGVFLPGGLPGANHLRDDAGVQTFVREQAGRGTLIAAICAAPIALEQAGILHGRRVTSYPSFASQLLSATAYLEDPVVCDGNVITSRGPGTAFDLALALVARWFSAERAEALAKSMLVPFRRGGSE